MRKAGLERYYNVMRLDALAEVMREIVKLRDDLLTEWKDVQGDRCSKEAFQLQLLLPWYRRPTHSLVYLFDSANTDLREVGEAMWKVIESNFFDNFKPTKEEDFYKVAYETAEACAKLLFGAIETDYLKRFFPNGDAKPE